MATITREIYIAAPPDVVRRHVLDPERRSAWLDEEAADPVPDPDGDLVYTREDDAGTSHVRIEVLPEGDGALVRVTEDFEAAGDEADGDGEVVALASIGIDVGRPAPVGIVGEEQHPAVLARVA